MGKLSEQSALAIFRHAVHSAANGAAESPASNQRENSPHWHAWQGIIENQLQRWESNRAALEDDGVDPPADETIATAIRIARHLQLSEMEPPTSVTLDPNGGIVFEIAEGSDSEVLYLWDDGQIEYQRFEGSKLTERQLLSE